MNNLRKIDMDEVNKRINDGLITVRNHPFLDLRILNYTHRTQYGFLWDQFTKICRGLIINENNYILNNPFPKFYNLGETEDTILQNLPQDAPVILEKLDGVLGILYREGDNIAIATRGSFDSPYAKWATRWLRLKGYSLDDFKKDYTYLFEIIDPMSKIVVNYKNRSELVLLAVRYYNGNEIDHVKEAQELGFSYAKEYSFEKIEDLIKYLDSSKGNEFEGFVIKYNNGLRIKVKSEDYRRIQRVLIGISEKDIWVRLKDSGNIDTILENVPDEFFTWVKKVEKNLVEKKEDLMRKAEIIANEAKKLDNRLDQIQYIKNRCRQINEDIIGATIFLLDDRFDKAQEAVWKRVKPSGERFDY